MKHFFLSFILIATFGSVISQQPTLMLVFSAQTNKFNNSLDSIFIENHTQGGDTMLYFPDSVLLIDLGTGISNEFYKTSGFEVSQNQPNPIVGQTEFSITTIKKSEAYIIVSDLTGRELLRYQKTLNCGKNLFEFKPGPEYFYVLTVMVNQYRKSIKMINDPLHSSGAGNCSLSYSGNKEIIPQHKNAKSKSGFVFSPGDLLIYTGFTDSTERKISDRPMDYQYYVFQFNGETCPGTPYVWDIDGNVYNTVQISNQCYMKENLKTTTFSYGTPILNVIDSSWADITSGAYVWYNNNPGFSYAYGALYNGFAVSGLCPEGWEVPTVSQLEDMKDFIQQYWNNNGGEALKACRQLNYSWGMCNATKHPRWEENIQHHGVDAYGFAVMPGGARFPDGSFDHIGYYSYIWTSSVWGYNQVFYYLISYTHGFHFFDYDRHHGFSVRCIKNNRK